MGFFKRKKEVDPTPAESADPAGGEQPASDSGPPTTQFLTGDERTDRGTVQVLLDAIRGVSESRDLDALLIDIVDRSVEITGAERGLLLLRGDDGELGVRVKRNHGAKELEGDVRFSTTVARRVLNEVEPVRATVQSESEALELGRSVYDLKLRAVMCVPLAPEARAGQEQKRPSGVLYVDSRAASRQFSQRDLALFAALAQHISIALQNARLHLDSLEKVRLEQSLELAGAIQRDLMPRVPDNVP
ncbi:MAG: GAF domain-containing protein, partial [Planctomycetota bacterium]|nr:GAF domain-containing protein [Planctomycetota bacterium]